MTDYAAGRPQIGPGKWVDPDAFNLGNGGMTEAEERTYFGLWCLLKAPLLMGNDIRNMSAQTLAIYGAEEVVQVDQTWGGAIGYVPYWLEVRHFGLLSGASAARAPGWSVTLPAAHAQCKTGRFRADTLLRGAVSRAQGTGCRRRSLRWAMCGRRRTSAVAGTWLR